MKIKLNLKTFRLIVEGIAFLLLLCNMVWLVTVTMDLNRGQTLAWAPNGFIAWGSPLHFIIVFIVGMLIYAGLTIIVRYKNLFGVSLFAGEHTGEAKYGVTLLLFSMLKIYSLSMFLAIMYNMYAHVKRSPTHPPLEWLVFTLMGLALLTIVAYVVTLLVMNRRQSHTR